MRNPDLDKTLPIDKNIGELMKDERGEYRMINGRKVYELKGDDQNTRDLNLIMNRVRASGLKPSEYLKQMCNEK